jgi:PBP4 family serine-type D-alanyl-D-alanine carboxypeptidase
MTALFALALAASAAVARAVPARAGVAERIESIVVRPEFAHAIWGVEIRALDSGKDLYERNPRVLFVPGSTAKLVTEGSALALLGPDHVFRTRLLAARPVHDGRVDGDIVLVGSGDANLSGRVRPDGTLQYKNQDHSYGNAFAVESPDFDPLAAIDDLAVQLAGHGVRRIEGGVRVDTSLFPEGTRDPGTGFVVSPVCVNDNLIDVLVTAASEPGKPASVSTSPVTRYATFDAQITTVGKDDPANVSLDEKRREDGTYSVRVTGSVPVGTSARDFPWAVPEPSRFAAFLLTEVLEHRGITLGVASLTPPARANDSLPETTTLAEHVSPRLAEDVKITLKTSQNLHATVTPYVLGAVLAGDRVDPLSAGFSRIARFLKDLGLDLSGAAMGDGAGGPGCYFSPDFLVSYLEAMAKGGNAALFRSSLPVLGRDGTLAPLMKDSPAAGHVFAKTGTYILPDYLSGGMTIVGKALAGYIDAKDGSHLAFAIFVNNVSASGGIEAVRGLSRAIAEVTEAAYEAGSTGH